MNNEVTTICVLEIVSLVSRPHFFFLGRPPLPSHFSLVQYISHTHTHIHVNIYIYINIITYQKIIKCSAYTRTADPIQFRRTLNNYFEKTGQQQYIPPPPLLRRKIGFRGKCFIFLFFFIYQFLTTPAGLYIYIGPLVCSWMCVLCTYMCICLRVCMLRVCANPASTFRSQIEKPISGFAFYFFSGERKERQKERENKRERKRERKRENSSIVAIAKENRVLERGKPFYLNATPALLRLTHGAFTHRNPQKIESDRLGKSVSRSHALYAVAAARRTNNI